MASARFTGQFRNPGPGSFVTFIGMLFVALCSWGLEHTGHGHEAWTDMFTPHHVFSVIGVVGSILVAWLSKSPLKEKE